MAKKIDWAKTLTGALPHVAMVIVFTFAGTLEQFNIFERFVMLGFVGLAILNLTSVPLYKDE